MSKNTTVPLYDSTTPLRSLEFVRNMTVIVFNKTVRTSTFVINGKFGLPFCTKPDVSSKETVKFNKRILVKQN